MSKCDDVLGERKATMKLRVLPLLMLLGAGLGFQQTHAAAVSISAGIQINAATDFYQPLEPYGTWVSVGSYGRCFHPTRVAADWRPYSLGHWEYTDVGWYWVSDEPFGWATFHYGSWVNDPQIGWVWVPGVEWSPAWVVWRESDSYIGWAPCGPNLEVAAPSLFVFVQAGHFCDPIQPSTVIVNNTTIINNTRVVNNFRSETRSFGGGEHRMRVNAGPDVARVQRVTGRHFEPTPVATAIERHGRGNVRNEQQPDRQRSATTPERRDEQRNAPEQSREHSTTAPEHRAVQEPSGAERQRPSAVTPREQQPSPAPRQQAPVPQAQPLAPEQKPAVSEPSGAAREPAPSLKPQEAPTQPTPPLPAAENRSVREPSGAARESQPPTPAHEAPAPPSPRESTAPSAPRQAPPAPPIPEKPAIKEPSGATREAPQVREDAPVQHASPTEHAPVQSQGPSHAAPAAHEAPHGPAIQHERRNEDYRKHDQP